MLGNLKGGYEDLWKAIIRPPKEEYTVNDLGPETFKVKGCKVHRTDIDIKNKSGLTLKCSHFEPVNRPCKELPCVIYLHGNSSSRMESLNCLRVLLPQNITLFSFDFAGCGLSEGEYISLGWYEREDVDTIVTFLRNSGTVSSIGLWGRSMGAVTALMHADRDPSIAGLVLDSPFSSLRQLAEDLCKQHTKIPKFIMSGAMAIIKSTISSKAKFDINDLNPLKNHVDKAFIPALFIAGKDDQFISPEHTKALHKAYAGDKNLILVEGDHNSQRPQFMLDSVGIFFFNTLQVEVLVPAHLVEKAEAAGSSLPELGQGKIRSKIGNNKEVEQALFHLDDDEEAQFEDQMRKALEESMKLPSNQQDTSKQIEQVNTKFDLLSLDKPNFNNQPGSHQGDTHSADIIEHIDWFGDEETNQTNNITNPRNNNNNNNKGGKIVQPQQNINQSSGQGLNNNNISSNNNSSKPQNQNTLAEYFEDY